MVTSQADDVDLDVPVPIFSDLKGGTDPFPFINKWQSLAAQLFKAQAEIRVQLWANTSTQGSLRPHLLDEAEVGKYKPEPEPHQRIFDYVTNLPRVRSFPCERSSTPNIPDAVQLLNIVVEASFGNAGLRGNSLIVDISCGYGCQHGVVVSHVPEFFPKQEFGLAKQGPEFIQQCLFDISLYRMCLKSSLRRPSRFILLYNPLG